MVCGKKNFLPGAMFLNFSFKHRSKRFKEVIKYEVLLVAVVGSKFYVVA